MGVLNHLNQIVSRLTFSFVYSIRASFAERKPILVVSRAKWTYHFWISSFIPFRKSVWIALSPSFTPVHALGENNELFLRHYIPQNGDVVIDVGAGTGSELELLSVSVGSLGKVYAFEAHPETYAEAQKTKRISNLSNVTVFNLAVTDSEGFVNISDLESDTSNSLMIGGSRIVPSIQLGPFMVGLGELDIDYLKMNIEGAELLALTGLLDWVKPRSLCISCHDFLGTEWSKTYDAVYAILMKNGFTIFPKVESDVKPWESWYIYAGLLID